MINVEALLNWPFEDVVQSYQPRDAILYALGIGIGANPTECAELAYTYERDIKVFPSFVVTLGRPERWNANPKSGIDRLGSVHAGQSIVLHRPLAPSGRISAREKILRVVDKGSDKGSLIFSERRIVDAETGEPLATLAATNLCRRDGGWGGAHEEDVPVPHAIPEMVPHMTVDLPTLPQQALIYRLSGDDNALHVDPEFATKAGFKRPILHGLCTFGHAAHAVIKAVCGFDGSRLISLEARFSGVTYPGDTLSFDIWQQESTVSFQAWVRERNAKILDNGRAVLTGLR